MRLNYVVFVVVLSYQVLWCVFVCGMTQGNCASCYAFSAIGALESASAQAKNKLVELSEQNIVDCSGKY